MLKASWGQTIAALAFFLTTLGACAKQPAAHCTPGESKVCACTDGRQGAQACLGDGSGLAPCACKQDSTATAPASVVSGVVAPVAPVAPLPAAAPTPVGLRATYTTVLGPLDHVNSKGDALVHAAGILRQDRSRVQAGYGDPGDESDLVFAKNEDRTAFEALIKTSTLSTETQKLILQRNPKVKVQVFADHVTVDVLDPGTDHVACLVTPGHVAGVKWDAAAEDVHLDPRLADRGWRTKPHGDTWEILDPSSKVVATGPGPGIEIKDSTCTTPTGVGLGTSLKLASQDSLLRHARCSCSGEGKNEMTLSLVDPTTQGMFLIVAKCAKPARCKADEVNVLCVGDWGRDDCSITSMAVSAPGD